MNVRTGIFARRSEMENIMARDEVIVTSEGKRNVIVSQRRSNLKDDILGYAQSDKVIGYYLTTRHAALPLLNL